MIKKINQKLNDLLAKIKYQYPDLIDFLADFQKKFTSKSGTKKNPQIYLVGGAVRDFLLGIECHDYDFVVEGMTKKDLETYLKQCNGKFVDIQSRNFGVFKYKLPKSNLVIDIALPRLDIYHQYGLGHKNVDVKVKNVSIDEDLSRRDFTINAMAINLSNGELIDLFNGANDLKKKIIRAVGDPYTRFVLEDPTRIMRAIRLSVKFNFKIEKNTLSAIKKYHHCLIEKYSKENNPNCQPIERVSKEIIATEFIKGFDANPVNMVNIIDQTKIYRSLFPKRVIEVWEKLKKIDQPKNFHSEGNVWSHTILALTNLNKLESNELGLSQTASIDLKLAVFLHDFGKVETFKIREDGKFTYYNHPIVSTELANLIINHLKLYSAFSSTDPLSVKPEQLYYLIKNHMFPFEPKSELMRDRTIIKYFLENEPLGQELLQIAFIDASSSIKANGRQDFTSIKKMLKKISEVKQKLHLLVKNKVIYPVDGLTIQNNLKKIIPELKKIITTAKYQDLKNTADQKSGGRIIGILKEKILEDALQFPDLYQKSKLKIIG